MVFDKDIASILILISLPLQFNLYADSFDLILAQMRNEWNNRILSHYEYYFGKMIIFYFGMISSIMFIFAFYRYGKVRLIISIVFILNGLTWLLYYAVNEHRIYILYIIRSLQGIYLGIFQLISFPYIIKFTKDSKQCMYGCLLQFSMFLGLFFMNLFFNF